jgi:hypothetical protein
VAPENLVGPGETGPLTESRPQTDEVSAGDGRVHSATLDLEQATLIGMLPDLRSERFPYLGNASLTGSYWPWSPGATASASSPSPGA